MSMRMRNFILPTILAILGGKLTTAPLAKRSCNDEPIIVPRQNDRHAKKQRTRKLQRKSNTLHAPHYRRITDDAK